METIEQHQASLIRQAYERGSSFDAIRHTLDQKLQKGIIDQQLHSKAVEQLEALEKARGGGRVPGRHASHRTFTIGKKSGEGSRGGNIIGHTRSGHPIYGTAGHPKHKNFSYDDHKDAVHLHVKLREQRGWKDPHSTFEDTHWQEHTKQARGHLKEMSKVVDVLKELASGKPIRKAEVNDLEQSLEKGGAKGEGSRGGKILGHTKSGRPIYAGDKVHIIDHETGKPSKDHYTVDKHEGNGHFHLNPGSGQHGAYMGSNRLRHKDEIDHEKRVSNEYHEKMWLLHRKAADDIAMHANELGIIDHPDTKALIDRHRQLRDHHKEQYDHKFESGLDRLAQDQEKTGSIAGRHDLSGKHY